MFTKTKNNLQMWKTSVEYQHTALQKLWKKSKDNAISSGHVAVHNFLYYCNAKNLEEQCAVPTTKLNIFQRAF